MEYHNWVNWSCWEFVFIGFNFSYWDSQFATKKWGPNFMAEPKSLSSADFLKMSLYFLKAFQRIKFLRFICFEKLSYGNVPRNSKMFLFNSSLFPHWLLLPSLLHDSIRLANILLIDSHKLCFFRSRII